MISQWCKPQGNPHKSCPGQKHKSCCFHVTQQNKKGPSIPSKICRFCFAVSNQPQNHPLELTAITWSTILIPCPFVIGHTNTGSWIVGENSSTIQFPVLPSALVATCHWSPLQSAFCPMSKACPICTQRRGNVSCCFWTPETMVFDLKTFLALVLIWSASGRTIVVCHNWSGSIFLQVTQG